jgi:CheY-like chemotaxis protein
VVTISGGTFFTAPFQSHPTMGAAQDGVGTKYSPCRKWHHLLGERMLFMGDYQQIKTYGGSETILVVDDDIAILRTISAALQSLGYKALQAQNGMEAIELIQTHNGPLDLLLTDMTMPGGLDGLDIAKEALASFPCCPVILMSGYSKVYPDSSRPMSSNFTFLSKPFSLATLLKVIRTSINGEVQPGAKIACG